MTTDMPPMKRSKEDSDFEHREGIPEKRLVKMDRLREVLDADLPEGSKYTPLTEAGKYFCEGDSVLLRYLIARDFKVAKAEPMIRATAEWRRAEKVKKNRFINIPEQVAERKTYPFKFDKENRPIAYLWYGREAPTHTKDEKLAHFTLQLDLLCHLMKKEHSGASGVGQWTFIIDFSHMSIFGSGDMKTDMAVLSILLNHFPERLGKIFILDAPFSFNALWMIAKPLMNAHTKSKIIFDSKKSDYAKVHECVEVTKLISKFGGTLEEPELEDLLPIYNEFDDYLDEVWGPLSDEAPGAEGEEGEYEYYEYEEVEVEAETKK